MSWQNICSEKYYIKYGSREVGNWSKVSASFAKKRKENLKKTFNYTSCTSAKDADENKL